MSMIVKTGNNDKVRQKLEACRKEGLNITQNFISAVTKVDHDGVPVLICTRKGPNLWQMEYNDEFWDLVTVYD